MNRRILVAVLVVASGVAVWLGAREHLSLDRQAARELELRAAVEARPWAAWTQQAEYRDSGPGRSHVIPTSSADLVTLYLVFFAALAAGSIVRLVRIRRGLARGKAQSRRGSLLAWWILFLLLATAVAFGALGICLLLTIASWSALREYFRLIDPGGVDRFSMAFLYTLAPAAYVAIYVGWGPRVLYLLPPAALLMVSTSKIMRGAVDGFIRKSGALVVGAILLIFGPAHAALLLTLPEEASLGAGGSGWFIYLIVLTEINDIAQALVGRRIGKHKITPEVSPNKTWEGLFGGLAVTTVLAVVMAPYLTPFEVRHSPGELHLESLLWPLAAGLVISISGVLGDLTLSAVKRDVGVKDSSTLVPGMGGVLDRIDSLSLTAPCFYWFVVIAGHG